MTSVVLFITAALGNKTLGIVVGVIYSVGALQLVYFGINKIFELMRIKDFDIQEYLPDTLYGHIFEVSKPEKLFTALAVALIFTAGFIVLSVFVINKKDVK